MGKLFDSEKEYESWFGVRNDRGIDHTHTPTTTNVWIAGRFDAKPNSWLSVNDCRDPCRMSPYESHIPLILL
jgi:hypothetical protein